MTMINKLSTVDELKDDDLIPVWDTSNGDTRKAPISMLPKGTGTARGLTIQNITSDFGITAVTVTPSTTNDILVSVSGGATSQVDITLPLNPFDGQLVTLCAQNQGTTIPSIRAIVAGGASLSDDVRPFTGSYNSMTWKYSLTGNRWYVVALVPGVVVVVA